MKKIVLLLMALAIVYGADYFRVDPMAGRASASRPLPANIVDQEQRHEIAASHSIKTLFLQQRSDVQVEGSGRVIKMLADDLKGSRHQRFILQLPSGITVLVAHNIDLAPKLDGLKTGDTVEFFGEYEWNPRGGVIHWTHDDPAARHADGWLRFNGQLYQ